MVARSRRKRTKTVQGRFLSYAELTRQAAGAAWLVKGLIPADATGMLYGQNGAYKTFVALDLACHIAHGLAWCGRKTRTEGAAFFVAGEGGGGGILRRIDAWHRHHELDPEAARLRICTQPVLLNRDDAADETGAEMERHAAEMGAPALIVIDTLSQNNDGDENDATSIAAFFRSLITHIRARFPGCAILALHHPGHNGGRMRGSSTLPANTDFVYQIEGAASPPGATLTCEEMKDAEPPPPLAFNLHHVTLDADEDGEPVTSLAAQYAGPATPEPPPSTPRNFATSTCNPSSTP